MKSLSVRFAVTLFLTAVAVAPASWAQSDLQRRALRVSVPADRVFKMASPANVALPEWAGKVDPALLTLSMAPARSARTTALARYEAEPVALQRVGERTLVDLLIQTSNPDALAAMPGVELRTVAGDVAIVRADIDALPVLAGHAQVRYVEAARVRGTTLEPTRNSIQERGVRNDEGRVDIRADVVQDGGGGLPRAFRGEGVVVGVLDSGLDVTHPDFNTGSGTRVRFLLEYLSGGGEQTWTKAQIDAGGVTQRDGDGGGGHGTHVTGSAAGNGTRNSEQRGVAPNADLMFVKGVRDANSNGGFSDADVIDGVSRIFQEAATLGQPAVVNLSLGGHFSPHDGSSLYEQALSNLTGPGKIVVAAAGNEGNDFIHAGETVTNGVLNETVWLVNDAGFAAAAMWYDGNSQNEFMVGAYNVNGTDLEWLGSVGVPAGQLYADANGDPVPFVDGDGLTRGAIRIDARTVADPRNGDGTVTFEVVGAEGIDISQTVWSILSRGAAGRVDTWALTGGEFLANELGFPNQNEIPGDVAMTVGAPSTALGVVAVGSHVTSSTWTDIDGLARTWQNPGENGPVVPSVGQQSYFSSRGPTRDGRRSPDITAPGELIFSTLSSHLTEGVGVQRGLILQGGSYAGQQGTSMASPHVAGTVALMLQADPQLDPAAVRHVLQQTARSDGFTGAVPNDNFGSGKIDALAAVLRTLELCGTRCEGSNTGGTTLTESEPNNSAAQAQVFAGSFPFTLSANAEGADVGDLSINFNDGSSDDLEDLFRVTTTAAGLTLTLSGYTSDLDLYLLDGAATTLLAQSNTVNPTETIDEPSLPAGEYLVGVSFFDAAGSSPYTLRAASGVSVSTDDSPEGHALVLHPVAPNPVRGHAAVEFELAESAEVRLSVFDVLGREVRLITDGTRRSGPHAASLDVQGLSPGTYVVRLAAGPVAQTQRMVVVR